MTAKTKTLLGILILAGVVLSSVLFMPRGGQGNQQDGQGLIDDARGQSQMQEPVGLLMAEPQERPEFDLLARLQQADRSTLLRLYQSTSDPARRRALVWALGHLGGEKVTDLFVQSLTTEFKGKALSQPQEDTLFDTVRALGCAASNDDAAYAFLKKASNLPFWREQQLWQSPRGAHSNNMLVSYSIQAVAISGRPDAMAFLESLKAQSRRYLYDFAGDITQGMFYLHLRQKGGERLLMNYMLTPNDRTLFEQWIQTEPGAGWLQWANDQMRGPVPSE